MNSEVLFCSTDLSSIVSPNKLHVLASTCVMDGQICPHELHH